MSTKLHSGNEKSPSFDGPATTALTAANRDLLLQYFPQGVVAFDVETTGISPLVDKLVEISAYKVTPEGDFIFDALVNPGVEISPEIIAIHGITNEMVADAPGPRDVLPAFLNFIGDLPLLAHNARFDVGFLLFNAHQEKISTGSNSVYCTLKFTRAALPGLASYKLGALSEHFKITLSRHHRALDDATACLTLMALGLGQIKSAESKAFSDAKLYELSDFASAVSLELPEHLQALRKKMKFAHMILMKYAGGSLKNQWRPIRPVGLLPMPEGNILYAHCLVSNLYKSFALSKIREIKDTHEVEVQKILSEIKAKK